MSSRRHDWQATLDRVLQGKVEPKYDILRVIALGLDVSLAELMPAAAHSRRGDDLDLTTYTRVARDETGLMVARGSALEPEVSDGDLMLVERASVLEPGELVAVRDTADQVRFMRAYPESGGHFMFQNTLSSLRSAREYRVSNTTRAEAAAFGLTGRETTVLT